MKRNNYALATFAMFLLLLTTICGTFAQTISVTVCLKASDGTTGLQGATIEYAPGGTWYTFGTTGPDGCTTLGLDANYTNVKIRIAYNQASRELIQNIQTNPNYGFQTSETFVQVIDHLGNPISGALVSQGGGYWYDHGYTGTDGKLMLQMFLPQNYKFKATVNHTALTLENQPMPVVYQTGLVKRDNVYVGTIRSGLIGGWQYLWPTPGTGVEMLPGTYSIQYNPAPAGGTPEEVTVVAGQTKTIPWGSAVTSYTLMYLAGSGGTITGTTPQTVNSGGNGTEVTATPNVGYHFVSWSDGVLTASRTELNVTTDVTVAATFAINTYTLTYNAGTGGTITGTSPQTVNYNESGTEVTATPDAGHHFVDWSDAMLTASRTDANVTAELTVTANFALNTYELTVISALGGSITTPASLPATVEHGVPTPITVTPVSGYTFNGWTVETGAATIADALQPNTTVTLTSGDATVKATFTALPGSVCGTVKEGTVPLENVKVELRDGNGELVDWLYTNTAGYYCFNTVNPDNYQVLIVKPLGYAIDPNYQNIALTPAETKTVNFLLTNVVLCNRARDFSYWKHQFETHRCRRHNWQETLEKLNGYIAAVHQYYTPHFPIFANLTDKDDWEDLFTMRSNHPMRKKAIKQLAALVMNFVSLKIGQNTTVTRDNKTAGDVLTYVSQLVTNSNPNDDNLARQLAKKVNDGDKIASGIVPDGSILYKGGNGYRQINWGFDVPREYALEQNYPNPFNPTTIIRFAVPVDGSVSLVVFNTLGQQVAELMNGTVKPGTYEVQFDASNIASGLYFCRVVARGSDGSTFSNVRKMLMMK